MKLDVKNLKNETVGQVELPAALFGAEVNGHSVYEAVKNSLANKRQGTSKTLTRHEVAGTTRKPWKQKGTGRARAGSNKSPLWRGGGVIFGPRPKDWSYEIPRKQKRLAFASVLSQLQAEGKILVIEDPKPAQIGTKDLAKSLATVAKTKKALLVLSDADADSYRKTVLSARNIAWVKVSNARSVEIQDLFFAGEVILTKGALEILSKRPVKAV